MLRRVRLRGHELDLARDAIPPESLRAIQREIGLVDEVVRRLELRVGRDAE
jgi:hypothetical protein